MLVNARVTLAEVRRASLPASPPGQRLGITGARDHPSLWRSCQRVPPLFLWNGEAVMARKKSLWSELQRERERRQRVAQAQERANRQARSGR